jgi:hypothetical protein
LGFASETITRKVNLINHYVHTLGWKNGTAQSLIEASPVILKLSEKKLRAHTRIFETYGRPDMTVQEVRTLLINPLDTHMLALNSGIEYGKPAINAVKARVAPKERPDKAKELLGDAAFTALVGHKIIHAYMTYTDNKIKAAL